MTTQSTETVADIFAEIAAEAMKDQIPAIVRSAVRPKLNEAMAAMAGNPERTRELLLAWVPRLCRAGGITSDDLDL